MALTLQFAKHSFAPTEPDELALRLGEPVFVIETDDEFGDGWWKGRTADGRVGLFPSTFVSTANVRNVDTADFEAALGRVFPAFRASPRSVAGLAGAGAESQPPSRLGTPEMPHYEPQHVALTAPTVPKQLNHLPFAVAQPPPAARVPLPEPPKPAVAPKVVEVKKTVAVMEHKVFPAREIEPAKPLGPRELPTLASKKPVEAKAATNETTTSSLAAKKPLAGKVTPPSTPAITPPSISPGIKVAPGVAALASRLAAHNSAQAPSSGVREVSLAKSAGQPSLSGVQKLRMLYGDTESVAQAQPRQISADRLEIDRSLFLHETESLAKKAIPSRLPAASLGNLPTQHPDHWTTQDLVGWLVSIKLPDVAQAFAERSITGSQLMDVSLSNLRQKYGVESLGSRMNVMHAIMGLKEHYGPTTFGRSGTSPGPAVAPANITEPPAFKAASEQARVDFPALKPTKSVVSPGRNSPLLEKTNSLPKLSPAVAKHSTPDTSRSSTPVQRFSSKASFTSLADRIESVESDSTATLSVPAEPTTSKIRSKVIHSNILQQTPVINVEVIPVPPAPSPPEPVPELDAIRQYALDAASWHSSLEQAATLVSTPVETKRPPPPTEPSPTTAPNLLQVEVPTKVEATLMDEVYAAIDGLGRGWLDDAYLGTSVDLSLPPLLEISRTSPKKTVRRVRSRSMVLPRTSPRESSDGGSVRRRDDASVSYRYSASETTIHSIDTASETPRPSFGGLAGAAPSMKSGRTRSISGSSMNSKSERASNLFARMIGMGGGQKISKPVVKLDYGLLGRADREGFLYVRSQQDPESHKWRKRWCVLIGTVLYMTNGPGDTNVHYSVPLHQGYRIEPDRPTSLLDRSKTPHRFRAENPKARSFVFCAETQVAMIQWIDSLVRATARVTRQSVELIPIGSANATAPAVLASAVHYGNRLILPMAAADE